MPNLSSIINIILRIVKICFSSDDFPASCKSAIISPLIKKQGLYSEILKNYRPVERWMITNKLKMNDSKTECIVFRSLQQKCDLSGLSVNVGESMITQSSKMRDLGLIFD